MRPVGEIIIFFFFSFFLFLRPYDSVGLAVDGDFAVRPGAADRVAIRLSRDGRRGLTNSPINISGEIVINYNIRS